MVGARDRLLPPQLSRVSKRTQTPAVAQLLVGAIICEALGGGFGLCRALEGGAAALSSRGSSYERPPGFHRSRAAQKCAANC